MSTKKPPFALAEYDRSKVFHQKIKPLIAQLNAICKANNVQMAAMFCYGIQHQPNGIAQLVHSSMTIKKNYSPAEMYAIGYISNHQHKEGIQYTELAMQMQGQPVTPDTTTIQ
jgi:hypothetical protein